MSETLRTRIPVLISQLLDYKATVVIESVTESTSNVFVYRVTDGRREGRREEIYQAQFAFEPGVHGANSITLEQHLVLALQKFVTESMDFINK